MADEKITVVTENGKKLEVVVASMSEEAIWVVLGSGSRREIDGVMLTRLIGGGA